MILSTHSNAQNDSIVLEIIEYDVDAEEFQIDRENMKATGLVGFGCSYDGMSSDEVMSLENLIWDKRFNEIALLLNSKNTANRFLSVITIEKLIEEGLYSANESELETIEDNYKSNLYTNTCSGCTFFEKASLQELLNSDNEHLIRRQAILWLKQRINRKFIRSVKKNRK
ncbi:hypothetical protein BC781_1193 [Sediminitomix flava]|uniref:Uncharacterized protein n=2 Tax=Sediminitomix flava TaxID=379075 RepID=A0A315YVF5_SEDFL|nr:hypothetical protein BC781_1193 [Sediminitomix flava]